MKTQTMVVSLIVCALIFTSMLSAQSLQDSIQYKPDKEAEFSAAVKLFQAGRFEEASAVFLQIVKDSPRNQRVTGACIMAAKAYYELKNYRESIRLLKDLMDVYPQSAYVDDAHYTLGLNYYEMARFEDAALQFLAVAQTSADPLLLIRSKKLLESIASSKLSLQELQLVKLDVKTEEMDACISVAMADKIFKQGNIGLAVEMLRKVSVMPPGIKYVGDAITLLQQIEQKGGIKIGALLPLLLKSENSAARGLGIEFLQGIQIALDEYNKMLPVKIALEVRDTERDPSSAARHMAELCSDENVSAVIGPIASNEVFAVAGIANERGVPLITPTATANGIAAIGPYIFQANADYRMKGRTAAAFAYTELGARTFAVLAPTDIIGRQMAESFAAEIDSLGGTMISMQYYGAGATDLRTELMEMRLRSLQKLEIPTVDFGAKMKQSELNKFIQWGVNQRILDSLIERKLTAPVTLLFGENGKNITDSLKIKTHVERMKYDSLGLPVANIDVIFVPIASSEEIPVVSSQLKFFNIQAKVLGTGDWNDMNALDQNRQYTDGVLFTIDTYLNPSSEPYKTFSARFQQANNGKIPGANALFGYDVAKLLLQVLAQGKTRRADVAAALAQVEGFEGLHSKISLSMNRVNSFLTVLQYKNRQILRFGEIDLTRLKK